MYRGVGKCTEVYGGCVTHVLVGPERCRGCAHGCRVIQTSVHEGQGKNMA